MGFFGGYFSAICRVCLVLLPFYQCNCRRGKIFSMKQPIFRRSNIKATKNIRHKNQLRTQITHDGKEKAMKQKLQQKKVLLSIQFDLEIVNL